ncbi:hypothetical protein EV421DRAFT_1733366 [Armillaria borealis]|uniref:Uncharacterized protein n=1 Tax=Armillaria borealis TaxID=47425 RepID=A0AA39JT07_9AGAR|nr:hypothetical protein EV421DRAFT_1733366 [Armillaria borealis]
MASMQTDVGIMLKIAMAQSRQLELMWKKTHRILLMSLSSGDFQIAPVKNEEREKEIHRSEKIEKWLAQKYGMASRGGIDSTTVLQEAKRRTQKECAEPSWGCRISAILCGAKKWRTCVLNMRMSSLAHANPLPGSQTWKVASHGAINSVVADLQGVKESSATALITTAPLTHPNSNRHRCALQSRYNDSVEQGDNIIVYYVGNGSSYHCSEHFDTKCRSDVCHTEALCPLNRDTRDAGGKWIPDISSMFFWRKYFTPKGIISHSSQTAVTPAILPARDSEAQESGVGLETRYEFLCISGAMSGLPECKGGGRKEWIRWGFTTTLACVLRSDDWKKERPYIDLVNLVNHSPSQTPLVAGFINPNTFGMLSPSEQISFEFLKNRPELGSIQRTLAQYSFFKYSPPEESNWCDAHPVPSATGLQGM